MATVSTRKAVTSSRVAVMRAICWARHSSSVISPFVSA
jgi:hypothetical protein